MLDKITSAPKLAAALEKFADLAVRIYEDTGIRKDIEEAGKTKPISIEYGDITFVFQLFKKQNPSELPEETNV